MAARRRLARGTWVAAAWIAAAVASAALAGRVDLGSQALPLIVAAAATAIWWSPAASMAACVLAVLAFNWAFVPPRGKLAVELPQHVLLLATMLCVCGAVALLMARQRRLAQREAGHRLRAQQVHAFGEGLRGEPDGMHALQALRQALAELLPAGVAVMASSEDALPRRAEDAQVLGDLNADERTGLWMCMTQCVPFGPGTGRYEHQDAWYLPLRGPSASPGAALLRLQPGQRAQDDLRGHAQALCDQTGQALERTKAMANAAAAREQAQSQSMRNTLLAAVAHDYRTPLAAIMGAASSLRDQSERMPADQRCRLASSIVDEAEQLGRLTDNALQLVRLGTPGVRLRLDWESCEEIVGSVLQRVRRRDGARRVHARVEPGLPLVRGDAVLLVQLLENLLDNALKYSLAPAPVELRVHRVAGQVVLAVRDRGPGVPAGERARIFELYQRGSGAEAPQDGQGTATRGAGVGLAVCRAIAQAHGGELRCRARGHGGAAFEFWLPLPTEPAPPHDQDDAPLP